MLTTDVKIKIVKERHGDEVVAKPKLVLTQETSSTTSTVVPLLSVMYSVGEKGDMDKFNKAEGRTHLLDLDAWRSNRVTRVMPTLLEEQNKTFETLHQGFRTLCSLPSDSDKWYARSRPSLRRLPRRSSRTVHPKSRTPLLARCTLRTLPTV